MYSYNSEEITVNAFIIYSSQKRINSSLNLISPLNINSIFQVYSSERVPMDPPLKHVKALLSLPLCRRMP